MKSPSLREIVLFATSIFLAFFLFVKGCRDQKEVDELVNRISNYKDSAQFYKLKVNGSPVDVAFNQSLVLQTQNQLEAVLAKNDTLVKLISKFKKIASTTIINQYTTINGDTIKLKGDSIPCSFKPFQVRRDSAYYHFMGTIAPNYFSIDSLSIPNRQNIVIGEKKLGFLRGTEKRVEIVNSNPLIHTDKIQNYVIQGKKKWHQTTAFKVGIGILAGGIGYRQLTR